MLVRVSFLPVGTIVCGEHWGQQLEDPVATSVHQLPMPASRDPWDGNSSQKASPTLATTIGTSSYPDDINNLKAQNPDPRSLNVPTPPPRTTTNCDPQTVGSTTLNPKSHSVATTVPNTNTEIKHHGRSPGNPEPDSAVRRFLISTSPSLIGHRFPVRYRSRQYLLLMNI